MDIVICTIDKGKNTLEYTGLMNPLFYVQNQVFYEIKGDKKSIGGLESKEEKENGNERIFTKHEIQLTINKEQLSMENQLPTTIYFALMASKTSLEAQKIGNSWSGD